MLGAKPPVLKWKKLWWNNRENMKLPSVTIKQLLEAGVHLGHKTFRWNPKMSEYIFGSKDSIHIIDLVKTLELTKTALQEIHKCISSGGRILFVSTKKQASDTVSALAKDTSQFYVNHRWLGGMLTNWKTISNSIKRYKKLTEDLKNENTGFTKKEILKMSIQRDKLERSLGGIADMKKTPDLIFIIDTNVEALAVKEAQKLSIPIVAIVDTNSDPRGIKNGRRGQEALHMSKRLFGPCGHFRTCICTAKIGVLRVQWSLRSRMHRMVNCSMTVLTCGMKCRPLCSMSAGMRKWWPAKSIS